MAVYDACVLYGDTMRHLLVELAAVGAVQVRWTATIHDEWTRNLIAQRPELAEKVRRTRQILEDAFPEALVTAYESQIEQIHLKAKSDRHVVAAAITARARTIVTINVKHFPARELKPYGIAAIHPDDFIQARLDTVPELVCQAAARHRARLRKPAMLVSEYLFALEHNGLPKTAAQLRDTCTTL